MSSTDTASATNGVRPRRHLRRVRGRTRPAALDRHGRGSLGWGDPMPWVAEPV
ncbi:hypothetical protein V3N99_13730 [Dermatophilaceae bacterium Soc4.6]